MELNSLAKMERRGEEEGVPGLGAGSANLCTGGPSSKMLAGKLQFHFFFFFSIHNEAVVCSEAGRRQLDFYGSTASLVFIPF